MKTVTYRGADDWFRIDEPETITFDRGVPKNVSGAVAELVADYPSHDFEIATAAVKASQPARELAAKHAIDLEAIEGSGSGGSITKPDVQAAIKAALNHDQAQ